MHVAAKSCNSEAVTLILEHLSQQMSPEEMKEFVNARTTQVINLNFHLIKKKTKTTFLLIIFSHFLFQILLNYFNFHLDLFFILNSIFQKV